MRRWNGWGDDRTEVRLPDATRRLLGDAIGDARPIPDVSLERLAALTAFDPVSRLATFGPGVTGPQLEAQLGARGYTPRRTR